MKITWLQDPIDPGHKNCLWYGGALFKIEHKGYTFTVGAYGDVRATLYDTTEPGRILAEVKDKQNLGRVYDEMRYYIEDDMALERADGACDNMELVLDNNNWLEVLIDAPDGEQLDYGWVLQTDDIIAALEEVVVTFEEFIDREEKKSSWDIIAK